MSREVASGGRSDRRALEPANAEALRALRLDWGNAWAIGCGDDRWQAARRDGGGHVLTRASADGLALALRISHGRQAPVTGRRGLFEVDRDRAIDALRVMWGDSYDIGFADGAWRGARLDGTGGLLTGQLPDELGAAIRADWGVRSAR